ncbi:transmembrane protein 179B-like [Strix uralensis]|uniref:transmembrane protein 179B-like n=1 Tax=Strix uralensis TaxID=36305 RepID=UPI003DA6B5D3
MGQKRRFWEKEAKRRVRMSLGLFFTGGPVSVKNRRRDSPASRRAGADPCSLLPTPRSSSLRSSSPCSCQEAEHKPWGSYSPTRFYRNLYSAQAAAWVNVFLWCLLTARLLLLRRRDAPFPLLRRDEPEGGGESEAIFGGRPRRP